MNELELKDFDEKLPDQLTLSVIMSKKASNHPWADFEYQAVGVLVSEGKDDEALRRIYQDDEVEHFLVDGLILRLHVDECESYYHNMMSPQPSCFIVAEEPEQAGEMPRPYLVSMSFDEVHSYLEGDQQVYSVAVPEKLYQWAEAFVLNNYVAIKKTKRKLKNWHQTEKPGKSSS